MAHDASHSHEGPHDPEKRNTLQGVAAIGLGAAVGGAVAVPVTGYFVSPAFQEESAPEIPVCKLSELEEGKPVAKRFSYIVRDAWRAEETVTTKAWMYRTGNEVKAYYPSCTHLGCTYQYNEAESEFQCPCHGAKFNKDGEVVGGPPNRPLDRYPVRIKDGEVILMAKQTLAKDLPTNDGKSA